MAWNALAVAWRSLLLLLILTHVPQSWQSCSDYVCDEGAALLAFLDDVVDKRGMLSNWYDPYSTIQHDNPCGGHDGTFRLLDYGVYDTWLGVTCSNDTADGRLTVTTLDLSDFFLSGSISDRLADLRNLKSLDLSGNSFSGKIPLRIAELHKLEFLYLGDNQLEGTLPDLPSNLKHLEVQNNLLAGDISETNLFNLSLWHLDLRSNNFTGMLPRNLTATSLGQTFTRTHPLHLDLSHNQLEGNLPSDIGYILFDFCDMSDNNFDGGLPGGPWNDVLYVDLSGNRLSGTIPSDSFQQLVYAQYLNLSHNSLGGKINLSITFGAVLSSLDLSFNKLENEGDLEMPPTNVRLTTLNLQNNRFTGGLDGIFGRYFPSLRMRELRLGDNSFRGGELDLASVAGSIDFSRLRVLDLRGCGLRGKLPSEISGGQNLRFLDLSNNFLEGTIPTRLLQLPLLRELRLQNNSFDGTIHLATAPSVNQTNLRVLDLSHNSFQFDGTEMQAIVQEFQELRELRLAGSNTNRIRLPTSVGLLPFLEVLDLSRCNLLGGIPDQYSNTNFLPSLKFLNLSDNSFSGSLPEKFGQMPELIDINVSRNNLSGKLPDFQFRVFSATSFSGNSGLCGPPLDACAEEYSRGHSNLASWKIAVIVVVSVFLSGSSCLFLGWRWRRKIDAESQQQDKELIATLLDRDTTTLMSLRDLKKATDGFSEENQIGVGGFGTVYKGVLENGSVVAIKKSKTDASTSEDKCQFLNEVKILSQVHHRNLVRLLGCCLADKNALLVFEFVPNGTLQEHLHQTQSPNTLTWDQRLNIAIQTACALDYLHSSANPPIFHLDVKSANILLDHNLNAKVADFGISKLVAAPDATHVTLHGFLGTFGYMDPELMVKSVLTAKSDVYAFGVVLLELITAEAAVDRSRGQDMNLAKWAGRLVQMGELEEITDPFILDTYRTPDGKQSINAVAALALRCSQFRSEDRPTMKEASRDLLSIQNEGAPPAYGRPPTARNKSIVIEMSSSSSSKGFTI